MRFWPFGRKRARLGDADAFFDDLRRHAPEPGEYTKFDQYRDFRAVFLGHSTPEQGRRVLWKILEWARLFRPVAAPGDAYETYRREGERNIGLRIFMMVNTEPTDTPTETQKSE